MTIATSTVRCRVCHRPLRSLISIAQGVGPVCMKKVRVSMQEMMERVGRGEIEPDYEEVYAMSPEELQTLVENDVRQAYLEQMRQRRRPTREPVTVNMTSSTRGVTSEPTIVTWVDSTHAHVQSASGQEYVTTDNACNCPHFTHRLSRDTVLAQEGCRHMQALRLARQDVNNRRREARQRNRVIASTPIEIHEINRRTFAQIDWTEETQRDQVLQTWKDNKPFNGTLISEDMSAWNELKAQASQDWDYQYENVLGGTGNSFGLEIEVEFQDAYQRRQALSSVHSEGIIFHDQLLPYHSAGRAGFWRAERDGSLGSNGAEFVSPILYDTPETWQQLEALTEILKRNGAIVTERCGGHMHLGIAPLDHRTYSWQRLGRIGVAYEKQFFRMGAANSDSYRQFGRPGIHRGTSYSKPLPEHLSFQGEIPATNAINRVGNSSRYTMFNTRSIANGRPAIEMRYPNGSIDHRQIQAQLQVSNAVIHQAAVIRNDSIHSSFTPRFSERNQQLRYRDRGTDAEGEEQNFRRFLDVIGNDQDRLAATRLWLRGKC